MQDLFYYFCSSIFYLYILFYYVPSIKLSNVLYNININYVISYINIIYLLC